MCGTCLFHQSRQLQPAERNYPVHDIELLAMKNALLRFRVYLLGERPLFVYMDHVYLNTAVSSPHPSQRMARWLSLVAEYNFSVEYELGRLNVIAEALLRRLDFKPVAQSDTSPTTVAVLSSIFLSLNLLEAVRKAHDLEMVLLMNHISQPSHQSLNQLATVKRTSTY